MPVEIEAKMRLADRAAVEARLLDYGAALVAEMHELNTFFDTHQHALKSSDRGLRVRVETRDGEEHQRVVITHKGPRAHGKLKSRSETELTVDNESDARALLGALGFYPVLSFEKRRKRFEFEGCLVEVDTLPYLGDFVEIEGPSDDAVLRVRERLGLAGEPLVRASYIAMLVNHLSENNIRTTHVAMESTATA